MTAPAGRLAAPWTRPLGAAARVLGDPRIVGVVRAGPRVVDFLVRSHRRSARIADDDSIVAVRPTPSLAAQAYLDEVLIAALRHPDLLPRDEDYAPAATDLLVSREFFASKGWIEHPAGYHREPPPPSDVRAWNEHVPGFGFEHTIFSSGWEPDPGEPGRTRWLEHEANRTAHVWVARAPGRDHGSWMVCIHGFGMGQSTSLDLRAFRARELHRQGINVAVAVLPLHGRRRVRPGPRRGPDDDRHGRQHARHGPGHLGRPAPHRLAASHVEGARRVGIMGQSLGGLVASLVASLDAGLVCVIAGVPVVDLPDLFRATARRTSPGGQSSSGSSGPSRTRSIVVSPLALSCQVPVAQRYLYAGLADRMSTFGQARRLWLHWDRPRWPPTPGATSGSTGPGRSNP